MRASSARLATSLSMLWRTPGYWIFSASTWPSCVSARCTWPMEAAATGSKLKRRKRRCQSAPYSRSSTSASWVAGIWWARSRRPPSSSAKAGGSTPLPSIDMSWPTFITAPRIVDSRSASRRALPGVSISCDSARFSPRASRAMPSAAAPAAISPTARPMCRKRRARPCGTGAVRVGLGWFGDMVRVEGPAGFAPSLDWNRVGTPPSAWGSDVPQLSRQSGVRQGYTHLTDHPTMDPLLLARIQFAANITFHILFPTISIALGWVLLYFKLRFAGTRTGDAATRGWRPTASG